MIPPPLLSVRNLVLDYPSRQGPLRVLDGVDFTLYAGESLGIVGESGSGKSQTALAIMGLLPEQAELSGSIEFEGQALLGSKPKVLQALRGQRMGMIFQDPMSCLNPHLRIGLQLAEGLMHHQGASRETAFAEAQRMLDAVKVSEPARRMQQYPHEFSGGMRQRVMIAMMLLARPGLLIADEPTTALDVTVQARILHLLAELRREMGLSLLFISHDLGVMAEVTERLLVLYGGRVMEAGTTAGLLARPSHPYTQGLLACRPSLRTPKVARLPTIAGSPKRPGPVLAGCPFEPRCGQALAICGQRDPVWRESVDGQGSACHLP